MKALKLLLFFLTFSTLTSCYEKLDFEQLDDFVAKPILTASLTNFKLVPARFFNSQGIQESSITDVTNFEIFDNAFVKNNVFKIDFYAEIKNEFDRDVTLNITFLNENDLPVYQFSPIEVTSNNLNYTYLEEIEIATNPEIKRTYKVKIEAELENTGTQMNPNSTEEFEFKSSVTVYIESEF